MTTSTDTIGSIDTALRGSRVVVLGGTSGIGLATARAAAERGADVTVVSHDPARVTDALTGLPDTCTGQAVDLTDEQAVTALFDGLGPIDHVVYTAGDPLATTPLAEVDLDQVRQFFEVRYVGAVAAVRAAAPFLRPGGSVTLTTGGAITRPAPGWTVNASVLGAVDALARALAVELAPIRVNVVNPGVVRTPLWAPLPAADRAALYDQMAGSLPVGRIGEPDDLARAYLYCMTQGYATGSVVTVDGGAALA